MVEACPPRCMRYASLTHTRELAIITTIKWAFFTGSAHILLKSGFLSAPCNLCPHTFLLYSQQIGFHFIHLQFRVQFWSKRARYSAWLLNRAENRTKRFVSNRRILLPSESSCLSPKQQQLSSTWYYRLQNLYFLKVFFFFQRRSLTTSTAKKGNILYLMDYEHIHSKISSILQKYTLWSIYLQLYLLLIYFLKICENGYKTIEYHH